MPTASIQPTSTSQPVSSTAGPMPTVGPTSVPVAGYHNCEVLSPKLQVSWTLDTANDTVFVKLCGCINPAEYMAFGISGDDSSSKMLNADVVVTWLNESSVGAVDYYLTGYAQVSMYENIECFSHVLPVVSVLMYTVEYHITDYTQVCKEFAMYIRRYMVLHMYILMYVAQY